VAGRWGDVGSLFAVSAVGALLGGELRDGVAEHDAVKRPTRIDELIGDRR
jgi:hypothetical protein